MREPDWRQGLFPGTFLPSLGMVLVAWGGETHEKHEYQVTHFFSRNFPISDYCNKM
jgi:hypothetical protein